MREIHNSSSSIHRWNSPIPYLFGGLALMLGLIALALTILSCFYNNSASSSSNTDVGEKAAKPHVHALQPEMEPKIVVIMAGDDNPTYLAKPISAFSHTQQV